jgi:hypothetical protein
MDRTMTHDEIAELLGAYALDAVEPDEAAVIESHLPQCPRCTAELAQHREVAALLANAGSDASVELWDQITARLDPPGDPPPAATVIDAALAGALPRRLSQRHRRVRWSATGAIAAVAAAVIVLLALQVGHLDTQVNQGGVSSAARAALRDPLARTVTLASRSRPGTTAARIVVLPSGAGYMINSQLHRLPGDQTYQLWGVERGRTISLGLLGDQPTDVAFTEGNGTPIAVYAVTVERAGGVVSSTHAPVAESAPQSV